MDDIWNQPLSPIPPIETSPASATPSSSPAECNGASHQLINTLPSVETANKGKRKRSPYWAHFDKILKDGLQKAVCKYCSRHIGCDPKSGTSALKNHIERCKEYPSKFSSDQVVEQYSPIALAAAVPWDSFPAARSVQQMMDTMAGMVQNPFAHGSITWPSAPATEVNGYRSGRTPWAVKESEVGYNIRFDMPGMTRKDVKVWVEEKTLVVEAEKVPGRSQDGQVDLQTNQDVQEDEWPAESYGKYYSRVVLPETVIHEMIKAEVKDGVLQVAVPKARAANRTLEINVQ